MRGLCHGLRFFAYDKFDILRRFKLPGNLFTEEVTLIIHDAVINVKEILPVTFFLYDYFLISCADT